MALGNEGEGEPFGGIAIFCIPKRNGCNRKEGEVLKLVWRGRLGGRSTAMFVLLRRKKRWFFVSSLMN